MSNNNNFIIIKIVFPEQKVSKLIKVFYFYFL